MAIKKKKLSEKNTNHDQFLNLPYIDERWLEHAYGYILHEYKKDALYKKEQSQLEDKLSYDGLLLKDLTISERNDYSLVKAAVMSNGLALEFASDLLRDNEKIASYACKNNGYAFEFVSERLKKNKKVIEEAIKNKPELLLQESMLEFVNDISLLTLALEKKPELFPLLEKNISDDVKNDSAFNTTLLKKNPEIYRYLSVDMRKELSSHAFSLRVSNFKYIPDLTIAQILNYYNKNEAIVEHLPNYSNKKLFNLLLSKNGHYLEYVDEKLKDDEELAYMAIFNAPTSLQFLSERLKENKELVKLAIEKGYHCFQYAGKNLRSDKEFIRYAISKHESNVQYIANPADKDLIIELSEQSATIFRFLPESLTNDREVVELFIAKDFNNFRYVSDELKNDVCFLFETDKKYPRQIYEKFLTSKFLKKVDASGCENWRDYVGKVYLELTLQKELENKSSAPRLKI